MLGEWFENDTFKGSSLLLLRLILVVTFVYHGYPKAADWGMAAEKFASIGFPGFLGPVVGIFEVVCGLGLLLGAFTRLASVPLIVIISVAIVGVQAPGAAAEGTLLTSGLERDLFIFASLLVILAFGPGKASVD